LLTDISSQYAIRYDPYITVTNIGYIKVLVNYYDFLVSNMKSILAHTLFDGYRFIKEVYVVFDGDKIMGIASEPKGDVIGEGFVTPALIDSHSHIGMVRHAEPSVESEVNEQADLFLPDLDPLDSVYFDDKYFRDAVEFGVLYSCIVPGSGNLIGGKAVVIRNFASNRREAPVRYIGYKMALGYNPRSTYLIWRGKRFHTRMGVYAFLHRKFHEVLKKKVKIEWRIRQRERILRRRMEKGLISKEEFEEEIRELREVLMMEFSPVDRAILEILNREKRIKVHVHKEDDAIFLVEIMKRYNLVGMADHLEDVHHLEIFRFLRDNDVPIVYGPIDSLAYKTELKHESYRNVKLLIESGAKFSLMTDHPVVLSRNLILGLRYFLMYGMGEEEALAVITRNAAEILGIDDLLGTIEPGKLASLVVWDRNPFYLGAKPILVIGEGKILYRWEE